MIKNCLAGLIAGLLLVSPAFVLPLAASDNSIIFFYGNDVQGETEPCG